jgi:CRP-like cAMP-binding protein
MTSLNRDMPITNRLLAILPKHEYQRLLPQLEHVALTFAEVIYEPGASMRHVYFPNDSIVSLVAEVADSATLDVGLVGNEGMAGISVFMGVNTSRNRAVVQGAGSALRMKSATLRKEATHVGSLHRLLHRYSQSLMAQASQSVACNRFHRVSARLARWLLMTRDRLGADEFRMTQEFMSDRLGVRREGVTVAAGALQKDQLISYSRGQVMILNRIGLEAVSCECYRIIKDETDGYLNKN